MNIVVTGSIATDHLMVFPGRFVEHLVDGSLQNLSLSFLVDGLEIFRGGVGANIAFGLGCLGVRPLLVGAAGSDFPEYRDWLDRHNVDTSHVSVSQSKHTARFVCTTDADHNQIASFYAGAMVEARDLELDQVLRHIPGVRLVIVSPDDPVAMLRHTSACRRSCVPFAADPSQQLARMEGADIRELVQGAQILFSNEYERELLQRKTGWSREDVLDSVSMWVTTRGVNGVMIETKSDDRVLVPAVAPRHIAEPTGAGDAFRAGFLAGISWHLGPVQAAQLGCAISALVLEAPGTQEYRLDSTDLLVRLADAYGDAVATKMRPHLGSVGRAPDGFEAQSANS
jgi:adenosine kinase